MNSLAPVKLSPDRNPESTARRNRVLTRIWLPLAVAWGVGAIFLGVRDVWLPMGPPGLVFVVLGWWAHDPKKPFKAIEFGVVFVALANLLFAK